VLIKRRTTLNEGRFMHTCQCEETHISVSRERHVSASEPHQSSSITVLIDVGVKPSDDQQETRLKTFSNELQICYI